MRVETRASRVCSVAPAPSRSVFAVLGDRVEPGDAAEPDDLLQIAELLGDPEADVGRAAEQHGVGMTLIELGERALARGRGEERALVADEKIAAVVELRERRAARPGARRRSGRRGAPSQVASAASTIGR